MNNTLRPVLIVGLPRSGTTWFGEVLSSARDIRYVFEPDNEALSPMAWLGKQDIHRYPYLTKKDEALDYQKMWQAVVDGNSFSWYTNVSLGLFIRKIKPHDTELEAFIGEKTGLRYVDKSMHRVGNASQLSPYFVKEHPFTAFLTRQSIQSASLVKLRKRIVIKSVHAPMCLEWLASRFPLNIVLVLRNPYSIYASYKRLRLPDGYRNLIFQETMQRDIAQYLPSSMQYPFLSQKEDLMAFQIMLIYKVLESQISQNPEWILVSHDRLCVTPQASYKVLFDDLDLIWSESTDQKIESLNKPGKGFIPKRVSQNEPFKWKSELTVEEQNIINYWMDAFGLNDFFKRYINVV